MNKLAVIWIKSVQENSYIKLKNYAMTDYQLHN